MRLIAAARRVASPCLRRWESTAAASGTGEYRFGITAEQAGAQNELVRRVLSLENAAQAEQNAARVTRAVEVFQREAGDTGSPEVQGECGERCCLGRRSFVFVSLRPRVGGWLTWCVSLSFPSPSPLHARSFSLSDPPPSLPCSRGAYEAHRVHDGPLENAQEGPALAARDDGDDQQTAEDAHVPAA